MKRTFTIFAALLIATTVWLPCLHLFFRPQLADWWTPEPRGVPPKAREMAAFHLRLWSEPESRARELRNMRGSNPEWDFMGRTFLVLSLANIALREPETQAQTLAVMDTVIDETLRLEAEHGKLYFLMDYARGGRWMAEPARSLFQDGEIALTLAARCLVQDRPDYRCELRNRVDAMKKQMRQSPVLCGESYPDECWTFCNAVAIAAIRLSDTLDGSRAHDPLIRDWLAAAKTKLTDRRTGLLISSFTADGRRGDGPEGSSLWMAAHCLQLVDAEFAQDQYRRARTALGRSLLGFGYAREWPPGLENAADVDSGPIIPGLQVSAGSSGLAFLGAATFGDRAWLRQLLTSLNYGGFPQKRDGTLRFRASNQVGDAAILYALVQGPLWAEARNRYDKLAP